MNDNELQQSLANLSAEHLEAIKKLVDKAEQSK